MRQLASDTDIANPLLIDLHPGMALNVGYQIQEDDTVLTRAGTAQAAVENHFPQGVYFKLTQQGWGISIAKTVEFQRRYLRGSSP